MRVGITCGYRAWPRPSNRLGRSKDVKRSETVNRTIDIGLLVIALVLTFTESLFAPIGFFALGLFHLFQAADGGKNSEGYKFHLVIGMVLATLAFTGVFVASYIDQQTIGVYEEINAK